MFFELKFSISYGILLSSKSFAATISTDSTSPWRRFDMILFFPFVNPISVNSINITIIYFIGKLLCLKQKYFT